MKDQHKKDVVYDYGSWLASGACRTELFALLLARKHTTPAIVSCGWCQIKYGSWLRILYLALTDRRAQVVKGGEAAFHDFAKRGDITLSWRWRDDLLRTRPHTDR